MCALAKLDDNVNKKLQHQYAAKLVEDLRKSVHYASIFTEVQKVVSTTAVKKDDFKNTLITALRQTGLETELKNSVYHWMRLNNNCNYLKIKEDEKFTDWKSHLDKIQIHWEKRIHKSIHSMGNDLKVSLAKIRPNTEKDEYLEKWTELSTLDFDLSNYKPVYAPKDFLEVLLTIYVPNEEKDELIFASSEAIGRQFTHIPLRVKTLTELRQLYVELSRGEAHIGVNPYMSTTTNLPTLEAERTAQGEKVLLENHAPLAQEFLKRGSPRCLRSKLWAQVLDSELKITHRAHFETLKKLVLQYDLMVDKIVIKDIQLTASNDDQYFVFEDVLYQVLLCFSRDSEILFLLKDKPGAPLKVQLKNKMGSDEGIANTVLFPPSGVIPFHGFSMYATPFCYLYDDPIALYFTFRAFYLRYFYRLHSLNGHPQGIISLCLLFERLLQTHEPQLWCHIKNCGVQPIRLVFKWLMRAFSGHLPPEQLLFLWDQILAYDSLEVISLLAVCIITFRKDVLMQVDTLVNMENVLSDLSTIMVIPLLQMALLND